LALKVNGAQQASVVVSEDDMLGLCVAGFALVSYGAVIGRSIASGKRLAPYALLLGLHGLSALWYWSARQHGGGGDAAGNGMSAGLMGLLWLAVNVGLTVVALVVFVARKYLRDLSADPRA
jgi:hypothetical protein